MSDLYISDLTFPTVKYGKKETPWNLYPLVHRGGAAADIRKVGSLISDGKLGLPIAERLPLVTLLHDAIQGVLTGGGSRYSAKSKIQCLREFYTWIDTTGRSPELSSVERLYLEWTDHLLYRQRVTKDLKPQTASDKASTVAQILDQVLELKTGLFRLSRVKQKNNHKKKVLGAQADKVVLVDTFTFGHALLDIADALTVEVIRGPLPVLIHFRTGQVLEEWSRLVPANKVKHLTQENVRSQTKKKVIHARAAWVADISWRTRHPLMNLRIEAEMLIFIAQTQMNLAQAYKLKVGKFSYQSHLDGYQVRRIYKSRRKGEVEFEIFSGYRLVFERYLEWRKTMFPNDDEGLLFPLSSPQGRSHEKAPSLSAVRTKCTQLNIQFFGPRTLRKIKINWLMRHSRDPALTADLAQHTQETLFRDYNQPHHQVAVTEISQFHALTDPAIAPPGPGMCIEAVPKSLSGLPQEAPRPDCVNPAGCLFCTHQRDIDSAEHVWSLATYRHYKSLELSRYRPLHNSSAPHPAAATVDRLTTKLKHFELSSEVRALWVSEALKRIEEGDFHLKWDGFIRLVEIHV